MDGHDNRLRTLQKDRATETIYSRLCRHPSRICYFSGLTRSTTENVSWYAMIFLLRFQEILAVSSPLGWRTSLAMSIRSIPEQWHRIKQKFLQRPRWWLTPTCCEHFSCSRKNHHPAVWVSSKLVEELHHLPKWKKTTFHSWTSLNLSKTYF